MSEDNSIKVISFRAIPLEIDGRWSVRMEADADVAADGEYIVDGEIHNEASSMSVKLSKGRQRISLDVTPGSVELWYPKGYGYPHIYPCSMKIGAWIGNAIIGFRTASWDDGWLLVNGRRIYLKSAYWKNTDDIERTVRSAADANMNALYADNPPEELCRAADRLGIIVLSSRPDPLHPSAVESVMMLPHPDISPSIQPCHLFRDGNDEKACIEKLNEPGSGRKALFGIEKTFRRPSSFDKLVYLTELKSAFDAINAVTAERIATGSSKGASIGTLRDSSALSESSLASDGSWKILHYAARLLYAPLCPLMEIDGTKLRIYAVNSGEKEENIELSVKIRDFHGVKKDAREYAATLMPIRPGQRRGVAGRGVQRALAPVGQHVGDAPCRARHTGQAQQHRFAQAVGAVLAAGGQQVQVGVKVGLLHGGLVQRAGIAHAALQPQRADQPLAVALVGEHPVDDRAQQRPFVQRGPPGHGQRQPRPAPPQRGQRLQNGVQVF